MSKRRGQSILEYVIVLTAIVAAVAAAAVWFVGNKDKTKGMGKLMDQTAETIGSATGKIEAVGE